jgi:recombination endonuclease VII
VRTFRMTKICKKCGIEKPAEAFYHNGGGLLRASCKECGKESRLAADKKWRENNPEKRQEVCKKYYSENKERHKACVLDCRRRDYAKNPAKYLVKHREWRYGITEEQYSELLKFQGGGCALCGRTKRLHIDHCHESSKVRGILCMHCNTALGILGDSVEAIQKVLRYLQKVSV